MGIDILKVSLEFSPKLGIRSLPQLSKHKESNVAGLFIVGDLADAPIIKVALNQGHEVAEHVLETIGGPGKGENEVLDIIIIGAGPAGIGAALALQEAGAKYVLLERERPFNTIQNFPKAKLIFSEPKTFENKGNFWFEDAQKEELIDRWAEALEERELVLHQPEGVVDVVRKGGLFSVTTKVGKDGMDPGRHLDWVTFDKSARAQNTYRAKRVILAIGRRGSVNKLGIPGEKLEKVTYALKDPDDHTGRKVLIVGGGDSAVEAAVACANAGADVTIAYRGDAFHRAKLKNQQQLQAAIDKGLIKAEMGATPTEVTENQVTLERGGESFDVPNDDMLVFIGSKLPSGFLKKLGIRMEGEMDWLRMVWISSFALLTYLLYVLKQKKSFFPFGEGDPFSGVPAALNVDLGFRTVGAGFWGTVLYSAVILIFGIRAYRKYPMQLHKNRYLQLIGFQLVFLFGIPELIAPFIIERPWRMYGISVPWPLWTGSLVDGPGWGTETSVALGWMGAGAIVAFVVIPLYVRRNGLRFCSYLCGCGGLAETLGDFWRHLAPRGKTAQQMEIFGKLILLAAVPVTLMTINDLWRFIENDALFSTSAFAAHWYALMVDFWLAAVLGVAFYPYLGNRFWCRFFCPLRAFMELLSKWFGKLAIQSNDKCIGCGECTRYCQMGIDVQRFAQRQDTFHNGNSACIHCGICIQVCPMEVLSLTERKFGTS